MPKRLASQVSFLNVRSIKAGTVGGDTLTLDLKADDWMAGVGTVWVYTGDAVLAGRLAEAINRVVAERKAELANAAASETEAA